MRIFVIESSPHKNGSSNLLADYFISGAREAGHTVTVFDAARAKLHPCMGCEVCGMSGPCRQKDDMAELSAKDLKTALIVAAWDNRDWTMQDISSYCQMLCKYLNFEDQGMILGFGCGTVSAARGSEYPQKAYDFGKSLK